MSRLATTVVSLICSLAAAAPHSRAAPIVRGDFGPDAINLDFDDLTGSTSDCDGDHITDQYENVSFEVPGSSCVVCARSEIEGNLDGNSDPNFAFFQQNFCDPPATSAQITFAIPVRRVGADFWTSTYASLTWKAYDASDVLIEEITFVGTGGIDIWSGFAGLDAGSAIIARLELSSDPVGGPESPFNFLLDDFVYEGTASSPVRPGSWGRVKAGYR